MVSSKARAGNDIAEAEAEDAQLWADWALRQTGRNPLAIWALLLGLPKRDLDRLLDAWGSHSCKGLAEKIAGIGVEHG